MKSWLDDYFRIAERGTSVRTEILGGATTFATMAYIIVVNPAILAFAGLPLGPSTVATILTAVVRLAARWASTRTGRSPSRRTWARTPSSRSASPRWASTWQQRLGAVFVSGGSSSCVITLLGIRTWLANVDLAEHEAQLRRRASACSSRSSASTRRASSRASSTACRRRLSRDPATALLRAPAVPLKLGDLRDPRVLLAVSRVRARSSCCSSRRVRGAILHRHVRTAGVSGTLAGLRRARRRRSSPCRSRASYDLRARRLPARHRGRAAARVPADPADALPDELPRHARARWSASAPAAGMLDERGQPSRRSKRPMLVDAVSCMFAALVGTSTSGAYIESATGIREGARTGLAAVVTARALRRRALLHPAGRAAAGAHASPTPRR